MDHQHTPTFDELLDACRPGSEDLALPEMAELARRLASDPATQQELRRRQQLDQRIGQAFSEPPLPPGLAERLLENLEKDGVDSSNGNLVERVKSSSPVTRRGKLRFAWKTAALTAVAALIVAAFCVPYLVDLWQGEVTIHRLATEATSDWVRPTDDSPWRDDLRHPQSRGYEIDRTFLKVNPRRWREAPTPYDAHSVVYDIRRNMGEPEALLFVIRSNRRFVVPPVPPKNPTLATQNWSVGAWRPSGSPYLYVLTVRGGARNYRRFLKPVMHVQRMKDLPAKSKTM